jgi:hypothetical protein
MISYEDLCSALAAYRARTRGEAPPSSSVSSLRAQRQPEPHHAEHTAFDPPGDLPPIEGSLYSAGSGDDSTHVGSLGNESGMEPVYDDKSNELDIDDVLSDEEAN